MNENISLLQMGFAFIILAMILFYAVLYSRWLMLAILITVMAMFALTGCVQFDKPWTPEQRALEITYQTAHAIDAIQTLQIENHPGLKESNWLLGEHPTQGKVLVWYMGTAYAHAFITNALTEGDAPAWICRTWQVVTIGDTAYSVGRNYQLGLRVAF